MKEKITNVNYVKESIVQEKKEQRKKNNYHPGIQCPL
jgi:hypothetical protein